MSDLKVLNNVVEPNYTDEQIEQIAQELDDAVEGTPLVDIRKFPSNNGQEETRPEDREQGEFKVMNTQIDPNSGEHKILGAVENVDDQETFEDMCERIQKEDINIDSTPITASDISDYINKQDNNSLLGTINKDVDISEEDIVKLLEIVHKKQNGEEFNTYKSLPESVQGIIRSYLTVQGVQPTSPEGKQYRGFVADALIDEFITNITVDKTMSDFGKELETLFTVGTAEIADTVVGYTEERNATYREYAEKMEDQEKKEKMNAILDQIDEAFNLVGLKDFSKKCRIKKIDLEKSNKIYDRFLHKYKMSPYSIYDINLAVPILFRNINEVYKDEEFSANDINAFFVTFCKQCLNYSPEVTEQHAYMYYVIYNVVLLDLNKGEKRDTSLKFLENVREVIINSRTRNNNFK